MSGLEGARCADPKLSAAFFSPVNRIQRAVIQQFCRTCPVMQACRDAALAAEGKASGKNRYGVFGGLTPNQRAVLARRLRKEVS